MNRSLSLYLDFVRVVAASLVVLTHFSSKTIGGGLFWQVGAYGHLAVILFFALSGYVIGYAAEAKEKTLAAFALARTARILSVATPALLLTAVADQIGSAIDPGIYPVRAAEEWTDIGGSRLLAIAAAQLFLNEAWWLRIPVLSNGPFWSLPYEVWYYAIFGAGFYLRGKTRAAAVVLISAVAGPKILLMMPIWLCGLAAWRLRRAVPARLAWPLFWTTLASAVVLVLPTVSGGIAAKHDVHWPWDYRATDHAVGLLFALHFAAASRVGSIAGIERIGRAVRAAASVSFSLYLYHLPILFCLAAILPGAPAAPWRQATILGTTLLLVAALGSVTERKKHVVRRMLVAAARAVCATFAKRDPLWALDEPAPNRRRSGRPA